MIVPAPFASLPNWHAAVVHFPIALPVCALGFDAVGLALRSRPWLDRASSPLFVLGACAAWAAVLTGERAADSLLAVPAEKQPFINEHQDWAERTAWFFSVVAALRLALAVVERDAARLRRIPLRFVILAMAATGQLLLIGTADRGGSLVYVHGMAVARPEPQETAPLPVLAGSPEARLSRAAEGVLWEPAPGDAAALGSMVNLVEGSAAVSVVAESESEAEGLGLEVAGRSLLVLPDPFGDVQVEARLDPSEFRGTVGVLHHVHALDDAGALELSTEGGTALVSSTPEGRKVLDEAGGTLPAAPSTIAVSAAGHHFKGMIDGATVVHGHAEPPAPGRVGVLLDGTGIVRLLFLRAMPLREQP
jgi:uncharacterized membrane protein